MTNPQPGDNLEIRLDDIKPTQPDDGRQSSTNGPIEVIYQDGQCLIQHGNHRYYDAFKAQGATGVINSVVVRNFYVDY